MSSPVFGNFGIRRLADQNQRFLRRGLKVTMRVKNFQDNSAFADMGFQFTPNPSGPTVPQGTTDLVIDPPPSISLISMRTIEAAQKINVQLRAGARLVVVSHTWVKKQLKANWFLNMCTLNNLDNTDYENVFKGPMVLGFVTDKLLLSLVDITHDDAYGEPMEWLIRCNAPETSQAATS